MRHRITLTFVALLLTSALGMQGCGQWRIDRSVHLNEVQVIGTHNSYHLLATEAERNLRRAVIGEDAEDELSYTHAPLDEQFSDEKVRQIELDLFLDSEGGLYSEPLIRGGEPYEPAMDQPGIKVLHIQDVDYHSNCLSLVACLRTVKAWSDDNPRHMPLSVLLELKDGIIDFGEFDFVDPEPFTAAAMDTLDAEIRSVFGADQMITPDDVRGTHPTLEEAVLSDGWPTLGKSRGKVMFLMDNGGTYRTRYLEGHPTLEGRVLFTNSEPGQPDGAFVKRNDAKGSLSDIQDLVRRGYVVRTRADSPGNEAEFADTSTRDAALASGAQWVSTDYPVPSYALEAYGTDYSAQIPGGTVARCNPVNRPKRCRNAAIDRG